jgi:carbamoyl-phosphate synthase large subunit
VGKTYSNKTLDAIAMAAVHAVDEEPHGIYGVDMTYDDQGIPNPTEINISRFFTTVLFFTEAGLNLPAIFAELGLKGSSSIEKGTISPLDDNLMWIRGMDVAPILCDEDHLRDSITFL